MNSSVVNSELSVLRSLLDARAAELASALADDGLTRDPLPDGETLDSKDLAEALRQARLDEAEAHLMRAELGDVRAALTRLTGGNYGFCLDCGQNIPLARLQAYPTAKRCRDCQQAHETARH